MKACRLSTFARDTRCSPALAWVLIRSRANSAKAAWARFFAPSIRGSDAQWPSRSSHQQFNARFEREARAISSLNHPHICTLYDIGPNYLVMELVEGETIAARLEKRTARGRMRRSAMPRKSQPRSPQRA